MSYCIMVTQLIEHEGIANHDKKVVDALMKEYAHLDEFKVLKPVLASSLNKKKFPDPSESSIYYYYFKLNTTQGSLIKGKPYHLRKCRE